MMDIITASNECCEVMDIITSGRGLFPLLDFFVILDETDKCKYNKSVIDCTQKGDGVRHGQN